MADSKWTWQQAVLESDTLTSSETLVLLVIANHMNSMGEGCYPSTRRIAKLSKYSEPTVIAALKSVKAKGWLGVRQMGLKGQGWKRNSYFAIWPQQLSEGTKKTLAPCAKALKLTEKGTKIDSEKALKPFKSNIPYKSPEETTRAGACEGHAAPGVLGARGSARALGAIAKMLEGKMTRDEALATVAREEDDGKDNE